MNNEPVVWTNLVMGVISAAFVMLTSLNVINLTDEQQTSILGFLTVTFSAINILFVRKLVTPLSNPKDENGEKLVAQNSAKVVHK